MTIIFSVEVINFKVKIKKGQTRSFAHLSKSNKMIVKSNENSKNFRKVQKVSSKKECKLIEESVTKSEKPQSLTKLTSAFTSKDANPLRGLYENIEVSRYSWGENVCMKGEAARSDVDSIITLLGTRGTMA